MNKKALKTLEYDKIIQRLAARATSPMGRALCEQLLPLSDIGEIERMQTQTHDALSRLFRRGVPSFGNAKDIRPSLKRLEIGSACNAIELLAICALLENTARAKGYGRREQADDTEDSLDVIFERLEPLTPLSERIRSCIISEEEIADDASAALKSIRRQMRVAGDRIHSQLASMLTGSLRTYLQDAVITMRGGRYCVPVKAEYKSQVPGMIHDQSQTGATFFIEPMGIVKLNNDIKDLEIKEKAEIEAILASLSEEAAAYTDIIRADLENMTDLDFIFARAALAMDMNANQPIFNTQGRIHLRKARHPLIESKTVVPIDVTLGDTFQLLIVTGPNTGGKTVSLKTVGLLALMGQAGLHIPALDRSELAVFTEVYADIGDEQSIEQSLSTFSSHMTNVVSFIEKADEHSLVLFDELGSGTDPTEGAALAISILTYLHGRGIRTMATTHYSELKLFALSTPGVENASCEFDVETLRPTYRLLIGIPGKSNAFAISGKLGLPDFIIEEAKKHLTKESESFEDVIASLEDNRVTIEKERAEIESYKLEIKQLQDSLASKTEKLDERKEKILRAATDEANRILQDAKQYADTTIRDFQKFGKDHVDIGEMERKRQEVREKMQRLDKKANKEKAPAKQTHAALRAQDLHPGDGVRVLSLNLKGIVSSRPDNKGFVFVQMGIMRSKVHISDLMRNDEPDIITPAMRKTGAGKIQMSKSANISPEIKLIGKTVDEAIAQLDKYLDDAYLSHLGSVRVVHGKGTGALRKGIHNYLRTQSHVKDYHLAEFGEGDAGVTIVTFK